MCGKEKKGFFSNFFGSLFTKNTDPSTSHTSSSSKPSDWICSQCSYQNSSSTIECELCSNCKAWDDSMKEDNSFEIIRSQDESQDHDVIILDGKYSNKLSHNGSSVDKEDMMVTDDVMSTNDDVMVTDDDVVIINDKEYSKADPTYWQCTKCTLFNDMNNSKCTVCSNTNKKITPPMKEIVGNNKTTNFDPTTHWACMHCSLHNSIDNIYCTACSNKRNDKRMTSFDPVTQWKCLDCSLHNDNSVSHCVVCGGRRNRDVDKHDTTNQWQCVHCSLYNNNDTTMCSACGGIYQPKVSMVTGKLPALSNLEHSMRKTRLYSNHTAFISISVKDKRYLIDQDAMAKYKRILEFCKQVRE